MSRAESRTALSAELLVSMEAELNALALASKQARELTAAAAAAAKLVALKRNESADSLLAASAGASSPASSRASLSGLPPPIELLEATGDDGGALECSFSSSSAASSLGRPEPNSPLTDAITETVQTVQTIQQSQAAQPRRSRSLVEDARADTQRNRQLLEELRSEQLAEEPGEERVEELASPPEVARGDELAPERQQAEVAATKEGVEEQVTATASDSAGSELEEVERQLSDFPRHISELDHCNHLLIKYEPELDPTHPGFHDLDYRARRKEVAQVAFDYKFGEHIPEIRYSCEEQATWKVIYLRLKEAYKRYACEQHNRAIAQLEAAQIYSPEAVPQLQVVSEFLARQTGWRLRPVAGLLSARDFLASLAFRVFQTTQYIRHWGNPEHSVEPDCIHELMGHIPMLCDPEFAQFSQELGLASLGASDEQIERFATLYWFTVEFGLCQEAGQLKCYGAGLLSSYGEMEHALESGKPALKEFVPEETAVESYDDSDYQVVYYVARSFEEAKAKMRAYAASNLKRPFELAYDAYACSVRELSSYNQLERFASAIQCDLTRLSAALAKLKSREEAEAAAGAAC